VAIARKVKVVVIEVVAAVVVVRPAPADPPASSPPEQAAAAATNSTGATTSAARRREERWSMAGKVFERAPYGGWMARQPIEPVGPSRRRALTWGAASVVVGLAGLVATSCGDDPPAGSSAVRIGGGTVHLIDRAPRGRAMGVVLFLHGGSYTSADWDRLGLIDDVVGAGWRAVAIDLPGAGGSDPTHLSPVDFLGAVVDHLGDDPVIVSPSASGAYSLPFVAAHADRVRGYVPVAPVGAADFRLPDGVDPPPTLVVWGSEDPLFSPSIAPRLAAQLHGRAEVIEGAGHSAYEDDTPRFWQLLSDVLDRVSR
jgi:abhydrolase domain-containing protein 14